MSTDSKTLVLDVNAGIDSQRGNLVTGWHERTAVFEEESVFTLAHGI